MKTWKRKEEGESREGEKVERERQREREKEKEKERRRRRRRREEGEWRREEGEEVEGEGKAGDAFTQTWLMPAFRVSTGLHVEHRRPLAGDAPHEGLLKVERRELWCLGFRFWVWGLGVRGFWVYTHTAHTDTHTAPQHTTTQGLACVGVA